MQKLLIMLRRGKCSNGIDCNLRFLTPCIQMDTPVLDAYDCNEIHSLIIFIKWIIYRKMIGCVLQPIQCQKSSV